MSMKSVRVLGFNRLKKQQHRAGLGLLLFLLLGMCTSPSAAETFRISPKVYQLVEESYGLEARQRVEGWESLVQTANKGLPHDERLSQANDYFNQVKWLTDIEHWGEEDYWASPIETLASNGGDCEDFSIGKFFSLLHSDIDPNKLRITYVKSLTYNQAHMVLAYYPDNAKGEPLILDNIDKSIRPASERNDLIPVYSFNANHIWLAKKGTERLNANSQKSLPKWQQVNLKMREAFEQQ
jgi:predicted transglutaminase-like cysteine proteinase